MKKYKILIACVLVMSILFTSFSFALAADKDVVSPKDAEIAAKLFLEGRTSIDAELNNIKLSPVEKYYDNNNELIAYVVTIEKEKNEIGYVTVSADYDLSPILEYSTDATPQTKINNAISAVLKEKSSKYKVEKTHLMYLGPLLYVAKITITDGVASEEVFYNLKSQQLLENTFIESIKSIKTNDPAKSFKHKWDKVKNYNPDSINTQTLSLSISERYISGVPIYSQFLATHSSTACGPTVGAMLAQYWHSNGYSSIPGYNIYQSQQAFIDHMANDMGTLAFTSMNQFSNGILNHFRYCSGYQNFTTTLDGPDVSYYEYKLAINRNEPVAILIDYTDASLEYGYHWVAGVGYYQDTVYGDNMIYIHNCFGTTSSSGTDYIDFDQYMVNNDLNFVYVAD